MKYYPKLLLLFIGILVTSCQKVIDIDLKNNDPEVMIEAVVTDDSLTPQTVKITKSVNFSQDNAFPAVSGALVTIRDNIGNTVILNETAPGVYQNALLKGVPGLTYYLTINADGKTYAAESTMPQKVNLDEVTVGESFGPGPPGAKSATPVFTEPSGKGNHYRFKLKKNNEESKSIFLFDDQIIDGGVNDRSLTDIDLEFKNGDTAVVTMMCLDEKAHLYFYSLSQNGNGPNASATPANPITNISGAKLGYFSAQTVQTKKAVTR